MIAPHCSLNSNCILPGAKLGFPSGAVLKNLFAYTRDARDVGLITGLGRSLGGGRVTQTSILGWEIPWLEEPGGLQSMASQRVRHDLVTKQKQGQNCLLVALQL